MVKFSDQAVIKEPLVLHDSTNSFEGLLVSLKYVGWKVLRGTLLLLLCLLFLLWITVVLLLPTNYLVLPVLAKLIVSPIGFTGAILLVFGGPILAIALLAHIYLYLTPAASSNVVPKPAPKVSLWTYPVIVDGLMGVVSAAELCWVAAFISFLLWAISSYVRKDLQSFEFADKEDKTLFLKLLHIVGFRFASVGVVYLNILLLPVARGSVLLRFLDIPFEHAAKYHIWLGHFTMAIFTAHGLCYLVLWTFQGRLIQEVISWKRTGVANLPGEIALLAGLLMWVTSLGFFRKEKFELFFYTHQLYLVFFLFMALHVGEFVFCFVFAGIFLFLLDRFMRFLQSRTSVGLLSARSLPCGTLELVLAKPPGLRFSTLSFVFLNIRGLSWLQWHPFSVSSSPLDANHQISVLIKPLGSWTEKLKGAVAKAVDGDREHTTKCPFQMHIGVEGPYGHEFEYFLKYNTLILVAGGIGVSPFVAILRDLLHRCRLKQTNLPREVTLIWAVKTAKELNILELVSPGTICPSYKTELRLNVNLYVTQELAPDEEDPVNNQSKVMHDKAASKRPMSVLVGTFSDFWTCLYTLSSLLGFFAVEGLIQKYYLGPKDHNTYRVVAWWARAAYLLIAMIFAITFFGGLILFMWNWWEDNRSRLGFSCLKKPSMDDQPSKGSRLYNNEQIEQQLVVPKNTVYGKRPDFQELFEQFSKRFSGSNVGVLVCGPSTLQTSVAAQCRGHNFFNSNVAFHYHSVSFDL